MIKWKNIIRDGVEQICESEPGQKFGKYFTLQEIANNKAKDDIKYISTPRNRKFMRMMDRMREKHGSITVSSCYRTKSFNDATPHADKKSRHLEGEALDWWIGNNITTSRRTAIRDDWENLCIEFGEVGAINYYTHGVHLEIGSNFSYGSKGFKVRDYRGTASDW